MVSPKALTFHFGIQSRIQSQRQTHLDTDSGLSFPDPVSVSPGTERRKFIEDNVVKAESLLGLKYIPCQELSDAETIERKTQK